MVVSEEMIISALDVQPLTRENSGMRVWQMLQEHGPATEIMRAALTAALASMEPVKDAVWYDGGVALIGTDGAMEWVSKRGAQPLYRLPAPPAAEGGG